MKNRKKNILIIIAALIIISNLPPVYYFIGENYHYQNKDGSFSFTEHPGTIQNYKMAILRFESFKKNNPKNPNNKLYRTFYLKPYKMWEWFSIVKNFEKFNLEYFVT